MASSGADTQRVGDAPPIEPRVDTKSITHPGVKSTLRAVTSITTSVVFLDSVDTDTGHFLQEVLDTSDRQGLR